MARGAAADRRARAARPNAAERLLTLRLPRRVEAAAQLAPARSAPAAAALLLVALAPSACSRRVDRPAAAEQQTSTASVARTLESTAAFDLVAAPAGALLAWVSGDGALHLQRFDGAGRPEPELRPAWAAPRAPGAAPERGALPGPSAAHGVADLVAASTPAGTAVAWTEATGRGAAATAVWIELDGAARRLELGEVSRAPGATRGGLALGARGDGVTLFARGAETACVEALDDECVAFGFFQLTREGVAPVGAPLSVPSPCDSDSAQLVLDPSSAAPGVGARPFDYAVCSNAGARSALTVFSIRPEPAYAAARELFRGCTPLGAARFGGEPVFVATCGAERRWASPTPRDGELQVRDAEARGLVCSAGVARLRLGERWLTLSEPLDRLELLAGDDMTPAGARAVWTGQALLVARPHALQLQLARYGCRGSVLVELPGGADAGM